MKLTLATIAVAVLCCGSNAFAQCRSDQGNTTRDVTYYKQALNDDLADYGTIFEESAPWSACTQAAADALYKKLYTTFHPDVVGFNNWTTGVYDAQAGFTLHAPFRGWLRGGDAALVHATALRLANVGKLTKPLDDLIKQIDYQLDVDVNCGWSNFWTKDQNSCMDDYSIGAMGYAWVAAFRAKRGGTVSTPESAARTAVANALSTDHYSICAWNGSTFVSPAPASPCTGNINDIVNNGYIPISFHSGDSIPYGFGLLTSVASASVGIHVADPNTTTPFLDSTQQAVVQKLYTHSIPHTTYNGGTSPATFTWNSDCSAFSLDGSGNMVVTPTNGCGANTPSPKMFPLDAFINAYAPPVASSEPKFDIFDSSLFCDGTDSYCGFFSAGRRAVYGQMAHDWVVSGPNFANTGLGDYTATFQTYDGTHYLSATSGGGSDVNAQAASVGTNERFSVYIRSTSSQLTDGDTITLQSLGTQNAQWVAAESGGGTGSVANANRIWPGSWETFTIHKLNGTGAISNGDPVALTSVNGYYVSANNGGGSNVTVDRTSAITWERFVIGLTHN
ncbi:MAG TPA: hypothetical protein VII75_00275 [Thermoanaerobaculia bacterium]